MEIPHASSAPARAPRHTVASRLCLGSDWRCHVLARSHIAHVFSADPLHLEVPVNRVVFIRRTFQTGLSFLSSFISKGLACD